MANKAITSRDIDFAKWYTDVVKAAHLADYSNVKGCTVFEPNGYAIWERMQEVLDRMFKDTGHKNVYMPVLIPENLMKKEGELINGFAPEVAWVTMGGQKELEERMCIRPTSETLFSDYYATKVKSYRDLPLKYNQWCNVMRWEKETRPFLRSREFLWQEGHTVHATKEEAEKETNDMLNVYKTFFENYLAIPVITGRKTEKEKFAGAEYTLTVESLMYNGVSLQSGTSHYFGQKFSKAYDIKFLNKNNELENAYQTSWGVTTRMIGALIMVHSDDDGLVLPPNIAPTQVAIIPIGDSEEVKELVDNTYTKLKESNIALEGIYTHFGTSGIWDKHYDNAINNFKEITSLIDISTIPIVHLSRSLTLVTHPKIDFANGVRLGIAMYGFDQSMKEPTGLRKLKRNIYLNIFMVYFEKTNI